MQGRYATAELWGLTVTRGYAEFVGAGIYNNQGDLTLDGCDIVENRSGDIAGGIYSGGTLWVTGSIIRSNQGGRGGGIANGGILSVGSSIISGNVASEEGGALYIGGTTLGASTIYLNANTIVDNTAPQGSALLRSGETSTVRLSGNIVEGNCHATDSAFVLMSEGYNIESPGDSCDFTVLSDRVNVTSGQINLGPLTDNGGATATHLPMTGSIAIDMIPVEQCGEVLPVSPLLDQRTVRRPQGPGCDVGSVEVVAEP